MSTLSIKNVNLFLREPLGGLAKSSIDMLLPGVKPGGGYEYPANAANSSSPVVCCWNTVHWFPPLGSGTSISGARTIRSPTNP